MKELKKVFILAVCLGICLPGSVFAASLADGKAVLCSLIDVIECQPGGDCVRSDASGVNLPYFVKVDIADKVLRLPQAEDSNRSTAIQAITRLDGKLILQGAEDGVDEEDDAVGWTMSIDEEDGRMIFSATRETSGFVIFGACTQL